MMDNGKNNISGGGYRDFATYQLEGGRVLCYGALQRRGEGLGNGKIGDMQRLNDPLTS